jgi:hypothetical protein
MNAAADSPSPQLRRVRIWLIVETIIAIPAMVLGGMMALFSPMLFDAPGANANPPVVLLFWSIVSFIPIMLFGLISAWVAIALHRVRAALWLSLLPLLPLFGGVVAVAWLQVGSGGRLSR